MTELIGAIIGGCVGLCSAFFLAWRNTRKEKRSISNAICSEMQSLIELAERRHYIDNLRRWKNDIETIGNIPNRAFMANPGYNFFAVFDANLSRIGTLPPKAAPDVVRFYTLMRSLLEDLVNKELFCRTKPEVIKIINENISILSEAIEAGNRVLQKNNKYKAIECVPK